MPTELEIARRVLARGLRQLADEAERGGIAPERLEALGALLAPAPSPPRPSPAQAVARRRRGKRRAGPPTPRPADSPAAIVEQLVARHGSLVALVERFGFARTSLERWRAGAPCSPAAAERLRQALTAEPLTTGDGAPGAVAGFRSG